ncbi:glutathionylspermidine synthase family protein [Brevibacillus sp. NPDC058079]|uniref:glutathionylspermidine synthase family protein n=1 Tax=Brevibacillus sp. NPDC058079 TaxID=3346330 RepID=UPI0036ECA6CC
MVKNRKELYTTFEQESYMRTWFELVSVMEKEGFTWSSLLENEEWNQYMSPSLYTMQKAEWERIMLATNRITSVLQKTWHIVANNRNLFFKLNLPISSWEAVWASNSNEIFSYFSRYDLVVSKDEIKLIEANVDTPTGLVEPSVANRVICKAHNISHPNSIEEKLIRAWERIKREYGLKPSDKVFYTSYEWHEEDRQTVHFNLKHCLNQPTEYIGIEDIIVSESGLYSTKGEKIEFLYRLYPLEYLDEDVDAKGKKIGHLFFEHVASGNVKLINPPSAFMIQSKAILALIWELRESDLNYYTVEEQEWIKMYFLPTYFNETPFKESGIPYVSKPIWGREGGGVSIVEGNHIEEDRTDYYYTQRKIYQQYIEMPDQEIGTWDGHYDGKLLFGSHIIGGEPAGLFLRVGERITGNLSMFMGVAVE